MNSFDSFNQVFSAVQPGTNSTEENVEERNTNFVNNINNNNNSSNNTSGSPTNHGITANDYDNSNNNESNNLIDDATNLLGFFNLYAENAALNVYEAQQQNNNNNNNVLPNNTTNNINDNRNEGEGRSGVNGGVENEEAHVANDAHDAIGGAVAGGAAEGGQVSAAGAVVESTRTRMNRLSSNEDQAMYAEFCTMIVSAGTRRKYLLENIIFLTYLYKKTNTDEVTHPNRFIFTMHGLEVYERANTRRTGESLTHFEKQRKLAFKNALTNCRTEAVVKTDEITSALFISYLCTIKNAAGGYASKSTYNLKRAGLFRLHNGSGFPDDFEKSLTLDLKCWYNFLRCEHETKNQEQEQANDEINPELDSFRKSAFLRDDSKEPMSVELYRSLCRWFLEETTHDCVFAHCYLVLSWNLACRANNTAHIQFQHISWSAMFDAFSIIFAHTKTDPYGDDSSHHMHCYANVREPLSSYCSSYLFRVLDRKTGLEEFHLEFKKKHEGEVLAHGFTLKQLGTHSIRKGAASLMGSTPGGPSGVATCIRGGWSMGNIKDRYFQYETAGDQFCGRVLALLPLLDPLFASSPPLFNEI